MMVVGYKGIAFQIWIYYQSGACAGDRVLGQTLPLSAALYSHEATPQHQEALPYLCNWEREPARALRVKGCQPACRG